MGRTALALSLLLPACGCKPGVLPGWETSPEGSGEVARAEPPPEADPAAPAEAPDGGTVAQDENDALSAGRTEAQNSEGEGGQRSPTSPEGRPQPEGAAADKDRKKDGPRPLPRPIYAKVDPSCGNGPGVGAKLRGFSLPSPKGKTIRSANYRGRVLLVNFWGTWCKPCLEELPAFDRLYRRYRAHGLTLVAIATDEDPEVVRDFVARKKLAAKVAYRGESYANGYRSDRFPFSFVVDPKGVIVASYRGYEPRCMGKLEADIRKALVRRNGAAKESIVPGRRAPGPEGR